MRRRTWEITRDPLLARRPGITSPTCRASSWPRPDRRGMGAFLPARLRSLGSAVPQSSVARRNGVPVPQRASGEAHTRSGDGEFRAARGGAVLTDPRTLVLSWLRTLTRGKPSTAVVTIPVSELLELEAMVTDSPKGKRVKDR